MRKSNPRAIILLSRDLSSKRSLFLLIHKTTFTITTKYFDQSNWCSTQNIFPILISRPSSLNSNSPRTSLFDHSPISSTPSQKSENQKKSSDPSNRSLPFNQLIDVRDFLFLVYETGNTIAEQRRFAREDEKLCARGGAPTSGSGLCTLLVFIRWKETRWRRRRIAGPMPARRLPRGDNVGTSVPRVLRGSPFVEPWPRKPDGRISVSCIWRGGRSRPLATSSSSFSSASSSTGYGFSRGK